jgi:hypothetical protein
VYNIQEVILFMYKANTSTSSQERRSSPNHQAKTNTHPHESVKKQMCILQPAIAQAMHPVKLQRQQTQAQASGKSKR